MSPTTRESLDQLRAANPARVEVDRGHGASAQAALSRILADSSSPPTSPEDRRRGRSSRRLVLVLAVMVLGAGGAVAATDPFGWWSANPNQAQYRADPSVHVPTPTAQKIICRGGSGPKLRCVPGRSGQAYTRIDTISPPAGSAFTRGHVLSYITKQLAAGKMTAAQAARFRADLARVRDSFFPKYRLVSRYGTYGSGEQTGKKAVPPAGVATFLICQSTGQTLSCQDLNGDQNVPTGAAVYMAEPAPDWRPAPPSRQRVSRPPAITFTPAEYHVLIDMLRTATATRSKSSGHAQSDPSRTARGTTGTRPTTRAKP
jgi:hypothetical protein